MRRSGSQALALVLLAGPAGAADLGVPFERPWDPPSSAFPTPPPPPPLPRYFPRSDGTESPESLPPPRAVRLACTPRRAPVPTDAPDDPSYVGSPYGLGKPSYYGFTPSLGVDDPDGRSLLRYCP